jgi:flavin-binding protein dodecin
MSDHVYKQIKLTGSSTESMEKAVINAIERAASTIEHMRWFQVVDTRGHIRDNRIAHWQVTVEVGFTLEAPQ